jgi:hypothetical protein
MVLVQKFVHIALICDLESESMRIFVSQTSF